MPFAEDLSAFFNPAEFGQSARLGGATVCGILESAYALAQAGRTGAASSDPGFTLPTASVPTDPVGKTLVTGGVTYTVTEHQSDGTGVSTLYLERTA